MIRRGQLGARLCDLAPCPERWPCSKHGTRRVGDYEHLGRHAGAFELAPILHGAEVVSETVPCKGCGVALCSCAGPVRHWAHVVNGVYWCDYGLAGVWQHPGSRQWSWCTYESATSPRVVSAGCADSRDKAMLAAEALLP